jgi:hypothetical protein
MENKCTSRINPNKLKEVITADEKLWSGERREVGVIGIFIAERKRRVIASRANGELIQGR